VTRAARSLGADASAALAEGDVVLLRSDVLAAAAELEPTALQTLDAIHLATALSLGGAFDAFVATTSACSRPPTLTASGPPRLGRRLGAEAVVDPTAQGTRVARTDARCASDC
jgi:hypothetical protein